jgi:hypothetical protein
MSAIVPQSLKPVLKELGIQETKVDNGKQAAYIIAQVQPPFFSRARLVWTSPSLHDAAQNTMLKIFGVFLLTVMFLTLLWAQSAEAAAARRTQALEEQVPLTPVHQTAPQALTPAHLDYGQECGAV